MGVSSFLENERILIVARDIEKRAELLEMLSESDGHAPTADATASPDPNRGAYQITDSGDLEQAAFLVRRAAKANQPYAVVVVDMGRAEPTDASDAGRLVHAIWQADPLLQVVLCVDNPPPIDDDGLRALTRHQDDLGRVAVLRGPIGAFELGQISRVLLEKWTLMRHARPASDAAGDSAPPEPTPTVADALDPVSAAPAAPRAPAPANAPVRPHAHRPRRSTQELVGALMSNFPIGVFQTNTAGDFLHVNGEWCRITGLLPNEALGCGWARAVYSRDREAVVKRWLDGVAGQKRFQIEFRVQKPDQPATWLIAHAMAVPDEPDRPAGFVGTLIDITERKAKEERLRYTAYHDPLTRLPNRALLIDRIGRLIERARRRPDFRYAVMVVDLDRFKVVNDSLGHAAGDALLVSIARRLMGSLRRLDTVGRACVRTMGRLGSDEFIVLLDGIQGDPDAEIVADRIHAEIVRPHLLNGHKVFTTASIGIAINREEHCSAEDILRDADTALRAAKTKGAGNTAIFGVDLRRRATARARVESDLRKAVDHRDLWLKYQPIVSLPDARIVSVEALLRWEHPERGFVSPDEFIPIAEETGLIIPLGRWVFRAACECVARWTRLFPRKPPLSVNINLSCEQFSDPRLPADIDEILMETGIDPRQVNLEITESLVMESSGRSIAALPELKSRNLRLHMDDFGTGYSSLSYLRTLPIDVVKIDRAFVSHMGGDPEKATIVRTIVNLVHDLGLKVTAEGVETASQLKILKAFGCDFAQGYYFFPPLDASDVETLLRTPHGQRWTPKGPVVDRRTTSEIAWSISPTRDVAPLLL